MSDSDRPSPAILRPLLVGGAALLTAAAYLSLVLSAMSSAGDGDFGNRVALSLSQRISLLASSIEGDLLLALIAVTPLLVLRTRFGHEQASTMIARVLQLLGALAVVVSVAGVAVRAERVSGLPPAVVTAITTVVLAAGLICLAEYVARRDDSEGAVVEDQA